MVATLFSPRCSAFGAQRSQQTPSSPGLSPQPASWRQKPRSAARQPQLQEAGVQLPSEPSNPAGSTSPACSCLTVQLHDLSNQLIRYEQAWQLQKDLVEQVCREASTTAPGGSAGAVILLQHHPVYTLGAGSTEGHLRFDPAASPLPLFRTERGGEVTYHGPGQLVMYPILNLRLFRQDLHWYLRSLEEVIIRALAEVSGLKGERIQGLTGVWVGGSKVAAIGVRASRWVTYHGLALNVAMDLTPFQQIVPCGIADRGVTSVEQLLAGLERQTGEAHGEITEQGSTAAAAGLDAALLETGVALATAATEAHERQQLMEEYRHGLLEAFEEVFGVELRPG